MDFGEPFERRYGYAYSVMHRGDLRPTADRFVAYRGTLPVTGIAPLPAGGNGVPFGPDDEISWIGPYKHFVQCPIRGGELCNQVAVFRSWRYSREAELTDRWGTPAELDESFATSCDQVRAGVARINRDRRWVMYDREPLDNWTTSWITLLGDAAHSMVQYLAQGACQAIEDAGCLARQLTQYDGDAGKAFAAYQAERIPRTAMIQRAARLWGLIWRAGGPRARGRDPLRDVRLRVPVADPSKIIAAPVNYRDHQAEMNVDAQIGALGFFLKAPSSLLDPGGTIQLPHHDRRFDQEGELALVIGRTTRRISEPDALSHVFGYTGPLDITTRGGEDRSARKSFDTFTPMGPVLMTADEFGDPDDVELRCWVSGELRQKATTRDLIWGVARLVSYASSVTTLYPGDVIATGTPVGVGPLTVGDTIRLELSGLGLDLTAHVAADHAVASPTSGRDRGGPAPGARAARRV